ncbi:MAG TPA: carboxypeptidase-like regulatory domain-containing protein, partial [Chryseosolibacter sp.]
MKRLLLLCLASVFMLASGRLQAQERSVSGVVTSAEDGDPLPGVSVVIKGSTIGTVTDMDGKYSISVPSDGGT